MSPKETYCIDISNISPSPTVSTSARCLQLIMKTLVTNDFMNDLSFGMAVTNTFVMLNVTKESSTSYKTNFFRPQLRFHTNNRGCRYNLTLSHHEGEEEGEDEEMIWYSAPRPFKGAKSCAIAGQESGKDILDSIHC